MKMPTPLYQILVTGLVALVWVNFIPCLEAIFIKDPGPVGGYTPFTGEGEKNTYHDERTQQWINTSTGEPIGYEQ